MDNSEPFMPEGLSYHELPLRNKVLVLYQLSELMLDEPERFRGLITNEDDCVHWVKFFFFFLSFKTKFPCHAQSIDLKISMF